MVAFGFAFQAVNRTAVGAFDGAVGLYGQENARVAVPRFVFRAGAVQGQVAGCDNDGSVACVLMVHDGFLFYRRAGGMVRYARLILKHRQRIII